jgi:hypothetical protein
MAIMVHAKSAVNIRRPEKRSRRGTMSLARRCDPY